MSRVESRSNAGKVVMRCLVNDKSHPFCNFHDVFLECELGVLSKDKEIASDNTSVSCTTCMID